MKFSWKVFLCTIAILAGGLSLGGYYLIHSMFSSALDREIKQALDENNLLRFAFETAAANYPAKYERLQDATVEQIGSSLGTGATGSRRLIRIKEGERVLYQSESLGDIVFEALTLAQEEGLKLYTVANAGNAYYIRVVSALNGFGRSLNLETVKDISAVFDQRENNFSLYRQVSLIILLVEAGITFILALWLTRPVKLLSAAANNMAAGSYGRRAKKISNDELGCLTDDFNKMAEVLEEKILLLQEEARVREDFVAAFAHELKTPLTAIIGYAEVLRLRKLDEEKHFLSADYIYREGKRLENLSFRLLDLIVMKRYEINLASADASSFFEYIAQTFESAEVQLVIRYDEGKIMAEETLIKTVLLNLADNSVKASSPDGRIEITGERLKDAYRFTVEDFGCGIPEAELNKITEAFYMVDKSRSGSRKGVGLGLALCTEIVALHKSRLEFESALGRGTKVSFVLREESGL